MVQQSSFQTVLKWLLLVQSLFLWQTLYFKCRHKIVEAKFLSNGVSDVPDESRLVQYILSIYKEEGTDNINVKASYNIVEF